ncbi:MAG: alpha/beta hydrolase [Gammaproteobacteria bacterium]|nr:alpha/beta hydrolase [Gammaproteobacteria bacterium]
MELVNDKLMHNVGHLKNKSLLDLSAELDEPFNPHLIFSTSPQLDFDQLAPLSDEAQKYALYYGLDMQGRVDDVSHSFGYFSSASYRLACHVFLKENAKATVILLHGYYDHVGLYKHVIKHLLQLGFNVLAYDLPGHGLSSGGRAQIDGFHEYSDALRNCIKLIKGKIAAPLYFVGQSTGGAIAMDYLFDAELERCEVGFEKVILLAPLHRPVQWRKNLMLYHAIKYFAKSIERKFVPSSHDLSFLRFVKEQDPLQSQWVTLSWVGSLHEWIIKTDVAAVSQFPIVVVQGKEDGTVDWEKNIPFLTKKFPRLKVNYIDDGRHHLANESKPIRDKMLEFIRQALID